MITGKILNKSSLKNKFIKTIKQFLISIMDNKYKANLLPNSFLKRQAKFKYPIIKKDPQNLFKNAQSLYPKTIKPLKKENRNINRNRNKNLLKFFISHTGNSFLNKIFLIKINNEIKAIGSQRLINILEVFKGIKN